MKPTLLFEGQTLAPEPYFERVMRAVTALQRLGITEADTVALMMRNSPTVLELMLACRWLGATWCPINWHFKHDELRFILGDCGASLFIADGALLRELHGAVPEGMPAIQALAPDDDGDSTARAADGGDSTARAADGGDSTARAADGGDSTARATDGGPWPHWERLRDAAPPCADAQRTPRGPMLYTSGTTGRPKGIRRDAPTPQQVQRSMEKSRLCYGIAPGMRALLNAPMYHSAPNAYAAAVAQAENATLLLEQRFDAERTLQLIERHRLTHAYLVPTLYVRLLRLPDAVKRKYDVGSMRHVACTGSACPPDVKRAMIDWWGPIFTEAYGSSELGYMTHATSAEALARPGTAGRAIPGTDVRILDEHGRELPAGEAGLIYVRQPDFVDFSYQGNHRAREAMERDGFLTMADVGYLDRDGYLFIVDRAADMVISGGVNIYPAEIEQVLIEMPGVQDCAVFGIPHDEYGEALAAAVQPRGGVSLQADAVQHYLRERIAGYKVPR